MTARRRMYLVLYVVGLVVYGSCSYGRLGKPSAAPHFLFQADAWLHGRATIEQPVPGGWGNDWAKVDTVELADGGEARGRFISAHRFRTTTGTVLAPKEVRRTLGSTAYMSFPPLPTVEMLAVALVSGKGGADTIPNWLLAGLLLPLTFAALRRLAEAGLSERSEGDDLWLVGLLCFGTVMFYVACQGSVWHAAHVAGVVLALVYAYGSIEAKHPLLAGAALGAAALTRVPMAFMFPLFIFEAFRMAGGLAHWRRTLRPVLLFAAPVVAFAVIGGVYNYTRFGVATEFGHTFLEVRQQLQIEKYGLFSPHYFPRNFCVAFLQTPIVTSRFPFLVISGHGLALWFTTPALFLLISRRRSPIRLGLLVSIAFVALPSLFYQNTGWVQFGYRFSLDYMALLVLLIAACGRRLDVLAKVLIALSIAVNLYGAIVFDRENWKYFQLDYDHVKILGGATSVDN